MLKPVPPDTTLSLRRLNAHKNCARSSTIRYDSCWPACVGSNTANHRCNGSPSVGARLPMWLHSATAQGKCGGVPDDSVMCTVIGIRVFVVSSVADRCKWGFWFHTVVMLKLISPLTWLRCCFYCTRVVIWLSMLAVFGSFRGKQQNKTLCLS